MTTEPTTVTIGEKTYVARRLTLKQLRGFLPVLAGLNGVSDPAVILEKGVEAIAIGLTREGQTVTVEELWNAEASMEEVTTAINLLSELGGMKKKQPGE